MSSTSRRVAQNAISNVGRFALAAIVHFILTPLVIQYLGTNAFGLWSLAFATLGFVGLLEMGFGTAVVRAVARHGQNGDIHRRNCALSTLAVFHIGIAIVAAAAVALLGWGVTSWFTLNNTQTSHAQSVVWILGARTALVALPLGFFRNILFGEQYITKINSVQSGSLLIYAAGAWLVLANGGNIVSLAWVNLACGAAEHIAYIIHVRRLVPNIKIDLRQFNMRIFGELASFSVATFLVAVSALVLLRTDPLIVQLGLSLTAVALYAVAMKIVEHGHLLIKQVINVLAPLAAQLDVKGETDALKTMLTVVARHALFAGTVIAVGVFALGKPALVAWVGPEFSRGALPMSILMLSVTLIIPQMVAANVLTMTGHHRLMAYAAIAGVLVNVSASVLLVSPLGLEGVALGTLIATVVTDVWYVLWQTCRLHGISYWHYLRTVFIPAIITGVAQYSLTVLLKILLSPATLVQVTLTGVPGILLSLAIYYLYFLGDAEKALVKVTVTRGLLTFIPVPHSHPKKGL